MKNIALIFAGGTGQRMGSDIPKQFLKVHDKEIIIHTLDKFENNEHIDEIYVVCIEEWIPYLNQCIKKFGISKVKSTIPGGVSGQDSIFLGLQEALKENENAVVLIHDGVRPIITDETITSCVKSVLEFGTGITVTPCFETPIQSIDGTFVNAMPQRTQMYTAQAPQGFFLKDLYNMHLNERITNPEYIGIVDSCGLMFKNGINCHLVMGNRGNIKVTTPEDYCTLIGNYAANDYESFLNLTKEKVKVKKY